MYSTYNLTWGAVVQQLLQWKDSKYYILWVGNQHAMRMRHIVICGQYSYTVFLHIII